MKIDSLINKKIGNEPLNKLELSFIVNGFLKDKISEEKMAEFLLAVCHTGMSDEETKELTQIMLKSGKMLSFKELGETFDKHSSGGVSDSTTLIIVPLLASLGLNVLKMSGKSLGYTGGTIDKFESIDGVKTDISLNEAINQVKEIGEAIVSQTEDLVPADKKIYALRDKIGAVESLPLIASSIVSKKLASGAKNIVLDVKCGNGAFMKRSERAIELGSLMLKILKQNNRNAVCLITDMNEPLGYNIGAKAEALEAISLLKSPKECRLLKLAKELVLELAVMSKKYTKRSARIRIEKALTSGEAYEKFILLVKAQGGKIEALEEELKGTIIKSKEEGYLLKVNTKQLGKIVHEMCKTKNCQGVRTFYKIGDRVYKNAKFLEIYADSDFSKKYAQKLLKCFEFSNKICKSSKLIIKRLTGEENEA